MKKVPSLWTKPNHRKHKNTQTETKHGATGGSKQKEKRSSQVKFRIWQSICMLWLLNKTTTVLSLVHHQQPTETCSCFTVRSLSNTFQAHKIWKTTWNFHLEWMARTEEKISLFSQLDTRNRREVKRIKDYLVERPFWFTLKLERFGEQWRKMDHPNILFPYLPSFSLLFSSLFYLAETKQEKIRKRKRISPLLPFPFTSHHTITYTIQMEHKTLDDVFGSKPIKTLATAADWPNKTRKIRTKN